VNEPTRPNFQFHRAHPVAGPGVEPDDWVIPTDKPAGAELLPPQRSVPRHEEEVPAEPKREEVVPERQPSKQKRRSLPVTERAAGLTTRRPTELENATQIIEMIKRVRPQSRKKLARMIFEIFS